MNIHAFALLPISALVFALPAQAATPAGQVTRVTGFVMAIKAGGTPKALTSQSVIEVGDLLVSEQASYIGLTLPDGSELVLGPQARLRITSASQVELLAGQLRVMSGAIGKPGAGSLVVLAGGTTVKAGTASFDVMLVPDEGAKVAQLAQRAYARASMASAFNPVLSDAQEAAPLWEIVAQAASLGSIPPGLYVSVIDGQINLANRGGSTNFSAGQFGFTPSVTAPPVLVPSNPAIQFTPPPVFNSQTSSPAAGSQNQSGGVDCEVR